MSTGQPTMSIEEMVEVLKKIPPEPIGEWMRSQGFDPEAGCMLVLPVRLKFVHPPRYVRFSAFIDHPLLFRDFDLTRQLA
ncbi:hypothetical protein [Variovorax boronicumulans]|uniref:hypothetical protein n=1 Tax=Variovorax boronicumulans TaxID=436515 RepID=UPI00132FE2CA|nr:hypothetical protein [Variovorax boronicumulans]